MYNNHKDLLIFVKLDHNRIPPNVMLILPNVTMKSLNVRKKGITKCDKSTVTCDVGTAQYENETVKFGYFGNFIYLFIFFDNRIFW